MDPNANLKRQLELSEMIEKEIFTSNLLQFAAELAELVQSLNNWIKNGGSLPEEWNKK